MKIDFATFSKQGSGYSRDLRHPRYSKSCSKELQGFQKIPKGFQFQLLEYYVDKKFPKGSKKSQKNPEDSKRILKILKQSKRFLKNPNRFQRTQYIETILLLKNDNVSSSSWRIKELKAPSVAWRLKITFTLKNLIIQSRRFGSCLHPQLLLLYLSL